MARYGEAFRQRVVARLLPPESAEIGVVSREVGVSVGTLEKWREVALLDAHRYRYPLPRTRFGHTHEFASQRYSTAGRMIQATTILTCAGVGAE